MRYQEKIYIQNSNRAIRNKDILNVNMSSDFCIFKSPTFDISGATKVQCGPIECDISGLSLSNIALSAETSCFGTGATSYTGITWETKIYANDEVVFNEFFFYASSTFTSTTAPSITLFVDSVLNGFSVLGYTYVQNGTKYTIDKPYGIKDFNIDICVSFLGTTQYYCPAGFSATTDNDACQQINNSSPTNTGGTVTIVGGSNTDSYCSGGAYFYPNIQNNGALPLYYSGYTLFDQTGGTITALNNTISNFWGKLEPSVTTHGRLNNIGISASTTEWLGLSKCIDIPTSGVYYIGIGADNFCKFTLDGQLIVALTGDTLSSPTNANFVNWNVFPFELTSGKHIVELYGLNYTSSTAFGAEIYNPIDYETLTGATTTGDTGLIFSTGDYIGSNWELGNTVGFSCPSGYALNTCGTAYTCTQIITTGITATTTGDCLDNCYTICDKTFPNINNSSQGVYIFSSTDTEIPISFQFTGNVSTFSATNASFNYEIYKYDEPTGLFVVPPVYKSNIIEYSGFSDTNIISESIPLSALTLDGEYLIKGYFIADACTDFLNRLGKKLNTISYKLGSSYQLYTPESDFYFVGVKEADKPIFIGTETDTVNYYNGLPLFQQSILISDIPVGYEITGSTVALTGEYIGDVIVTLNGLTLAKDIDYTISGGVITFTGIILNGDVINLVYTRTNTATLVSENIFLTDPIISGTTGNQGGNLYYYNSDTGMYEIYTRNQPLVGSKILVMLNGVSLVGDIDYYQSTSLENRIILIGSISVGDVITIIYYPKASIINGITMTNNLISWYIESQPLLPNGIFSLEYSLESGFSTYNVANLVPYEPNQTNYESILTLTGDVGTKWYYRVKNIKDYETICGDKISSTAYSETVSVTIQSNAINSY